MLDTFMLAKGVCARLECDETPRSYPIKTLYLCFCFKSIAQVLASEELASISSDYSGHGYNGIQ